MHRQTNERLSELRHSSLVHGVQSPGQIDVLGDIGQGFLLGHHHTGSLRSQSGQDQARPSPIGMPVGDGLIPSWGYLPGGRWYPILMEEGEGVGQA